jgi:DNA-binding CsgD family transcriptional regulator
MDQVAEPRASEKERREWLASALENGLVLVDSSGEILWMDSTTRSRVNGELQALALPLAKPEQALDCFIAPATVEINGRTVTVGVVQEQAESNPASDVLAALETVMADTTSWFTRTVIERLKALRQTGQEEQPTDAAVARAAEVDLLSDREREVLGLICEGMSDVQMSDALGLSENTVRNHIAALYRKIGVNRRTQAIIWARERGITSRAALAPSRRRRPAPPPGRSLPY